MVKSNASGVRLLGFILICLLPGILGSYFTMQAIPTWYETLNQPSFSPPNWVFGPVWTLLYFMMGFSLYLISLKKTPEANRAKLLFLVHLVVNCAWSLVFFGLKNIGLAMAVIVLLWLMIFACTCLFCTIDKRAAYLLLPYLGWVSFAMVLNNALLALNP